jgi:HAD superfamily hydrolase (TIGR01549 family)
MTIEAIIFDVDGTLVDSVDQHARAWQEALADFGHQLGFAEVRSQIGKGADQLLPALVPRAELERIGPALEAHRAQLFKRKYLPEVQGFAKVPELFQALRAGGKRLALASSAKGDELSHYKALAGIEALVDAETSSDDAERSKPFPDIFQATLERLGNPAPERCVVVGDTPYDAQAAAAASLRTIGLLCGGFPKTSLEAAGCALIYENPEALLAHYQRLGDGALVARGG